MVRKRLLLSALLLAQVALAFAQSAPAPSGGISNVANAANQLCGGLLSVLPPLMVMLIVAAGVIYAAGQVFGAEVRSRANTWATALLIGTIIGTLIIVVAPTILATLYGNPNANFSCTG